MPVSIFRWQASRVARAAAAAASVRAAQGDDTVGVSR